MATAKVTSKGQITIPRTIRERLGLRTGDRLEFVEDRAGVRLQKLLPESPFRKYRGDLVELAGQNPDTLVEEMRGR